MSSATDHHKMIQMLSVPFPPESIKVLKKTWTDKKTGDEKVIKLDYIPHQDVTKRLNSVFGMHWDFDIKGHPQIMDDVVVVKGVLTVYLPDDTESTRVQFGAQPINPGMDIGDCIKAAGSDALKKCASLFGVGLHLYDGKSDTSGSSSGSGSSSAPARKTNKHEGKCRICDAPVPAEMGWLDKIENKWVVVHKTCADQEAGKLPPVPPEEQMHADLNASIANQDDLPF